jgi:hypothetical protein
VIGDLAAVDMQDLTGDVGRRLQEHDAVHDVADLAGYSEDTLQIRRLRARLPPAVDYALLSPWPVR